MSSAGEQLISQQAMLYTHVIEGWAFQPFFHAAMRKSACVKNPKCAAF